MSRFGFFLLGVALCLSMSAYAADTAPAPTAQQSKMKTCAAEYHKKGIEKSQYHAFMSQCLKKGGKAAKTTADKTPAISTDAK